MKMVLSSVTSQTTQIWPIGPLAICWFATAAIVFRMLFNRYGSPLRKYPGPLLASCTRLWLVYVAWTGHPEEYYLEIHRKYGPVVRIGPNEISFSSPEAALDMFRTGKGFQKTGFYSIFLPDETPDIFTEIRERVHAKKKKFAVPPYSIASVKLQTEQIEGLILDLLSIMDSVAGKNEAHAFDLGSYLHYFVFDVLAQFAFNKPFGCLEQGEDVGGLMSGISQAQYESALLGQIPKLERLTRSNPLLKYIPFLPKNKLSLMSDAAGKVLGEFQNASDGKSTSSVCLLKSLLDAHYKSPDEFQMNDILAISMGAIAAGSDTTASTMLSFCWQVLAHPEIYQRLTEEILNASLSPIVKYEEGLSLPYFQACLQETMRLQPALPFNMTRKVPECGANVDDMFIPGGTQVAVSAWVLHRDETVFGPNTTEFNPDRWLNVDPTRLKRMERCMFQFGGGSHLCIGRHLALFELNKLLPQLFRNYEIKLVDPGKPLDHVTRLFYNQTGLIVDFKKRELA